MAATLVIEKTDQYGGTTATSGGGIWIPCNHLMAKHGESDTEDAALTYLKATVGDEVSEERLRAYVQNAPKMLKFLEDNSEVKFNATPYADYFPDKPGGKDGLPHRSTHTQSARLPLGKNLTMCARHIHKQFFGASP